MYALSFVALVAVMVVVYAYINVYWFHRVHEKFRFTPDPAFLSFKIDAFNFLIITTPISVALMSLCLLVAALRKTA